MAEEEVCVFALSLAQERFWFAAQLDAESSAYNLACPVAIEGPLDVALVERCVREIVSRHEILRTTFDAVDGTPMQIVHDPEQLPITLRRSRLDSDPAERELWLRRRLEAEARAPFDLSQGPLLRLLLIELGPQQFVLSWALPHIVFDGWSTGLVLGEFAALYTALLQGKPSPLEPPRLQYADYAHWQRERVAGGALDAQLDYWRRELSGATAALELPTDWPRPALQRGRGGRRFLRIPAALSDALRGLARARSTTLYAVLVAAFDTLLMRYSGSPSINVGTPVTNRSRAELEQVVGCFANTVVLRADLSDNPSFIELLERVTNQVRAAQANADIPFNQVVEALCPVRDPSYAPLCQVLFALQPAPVAAPRIPGLELSLLDVDGGGSPFDLSLEIAIEGAELAGAVEYDSDLFEPATIERLAEHYVVLLESITRDPARRVSELGLLSAPEAERLARFSGEQRAAAQAARPVLAVHRRFAASVVAFPDELAVVDGERSLTYSELDRCSAALAAQLREHGVGPEVRVGLALPRSLELIVGMLGVLRAGGAYVPIDPRYPAERIELLVRDAAVRVLVCEAAALAEAPPGVAALALDTDELRGSASRDAHDLESAAAQADVFPEQAAYVLYTSGSTGAPKGVVISQRALSHFLDTAVVAYGITPRDRVLQFAAASFDASVEEIFPCLSVGATLVLRSEEMIASPTEFLAACARLGITWMELPTMYWHRLVPALARGERVPECLRMIIVGGEAALPEPLRAWRADASARRVRLLNTYGPAEATVTATAGDLLAPHERDAWAVSIGEPLDNTRVYVLDAQGQRVPVGVAGELFLGGRSLARGYLDRPALSAERFVPDPFATEPGQRLYRTGDRVRFRADGQLEFIGRVDHQVKLNGFRIEPGEIEARLLERPGVREALVLPWDDGAGRRRLVAYVAAAPDVRADDLRRALKERLPDFMVPASFMLLAELPQTSHGKVDRRALPAPLLDRSGERQTAESDAERTLVEIWSELLGGVPVGVSDNFFELGGDSILGLQVVSRARARGLALSPRLLFQHQTVAELARVALPCRDVEGDGLEPTSAPLTPVQRWFFEQRLVNRAHYNQSLVLRPTERLHPERLAAAARAVAARHVALQLRFQHHEGQWRQQRVEAARVEVRRIDLSNVATPLRPNERAARLAECQGSLNLEQGPLLVLALLDAGPAEEQELVAIGHHLVTDAVSWRVLIAELGQLYRAGDPERAAAELPRPTSFLRYARALDAFAQSDEVASSAPRWAELGAPRALPIDDPAGDDSEASTVQQTQELDATSTRALLERASLYRASVEELLLTALAAVLTDWTREPSFWVELEGHGRDVLEDLDVSTSVGWFTSLYPVRLAPPAGASLETRLLAIKEQVRSLARIGAHHGLLRHQHRGPAALPPGAPRPSLSFNYLGQAEDPSRSGLFLLDASDPGPERDPAGARSYELELDVLIDRGRLRITWSYGGARYRAGTIDRLVLGMDRALRELAALPRVPSASLRVPSDFPLAGLDPGSLERLLAQSGASDEVLDIYPLSPLQQGLLFHSLWEPGSGVYVEHVTCRLEGHLDRELFRSAWQAALDAHDVLRCSFEWEGVHEPLQLVRRAGSLAVHEEDLRGLDADEQRRRLEAYLSADRRQGFDLRRGPLLRLALLRTADSSAIVVWSHHHLILDGWSAALVLRDVFATYGALEAGREAALAPRPAYRTWIAWLRQATERAAREGGEGSRAYFARRLADFREATALPFDAGARGRVASGHGASSLRLGRELTRRIESVAREERVTVSSLVQGAWALLLARSAHRSDVVFGVTLSGRSAPIAGVESMVGLFINTLPLRLDVSGERRVGDWLRDILQATTELVPFEHAALAEVQAQSGVPSGQPLFESLLVFENYPTDPRQLSAARLEVCDVAFDDQTNYPLTLAAMPGSQDLELRLSYDRKRFLEADVRRLLGLVAETVALLVADPSARLGQLSSCGAAAEQLEAWNHTARDYAEPRSVHQLFAAQALLQPEAPAVIFAGRAIGYAELDRRANQLAHALRARGVGPETLVAVALERSVELVVALLAVLKAGAAYVPVDPEYPAERVAYVLGDCGAPVLLTTTSVAARLPSGDAPALRASSAPLTLCLDQAQAKLEAEPAHDPCVAVGPQHLAYVIYTSGSTGRPKGAGNTHAGLANRLLWMQERYPLTPADRVLQKTPISFDVSVWEFFWPLMFGATLVLAAPGDHRDGERLLQVIEAEGVTTLHFVPPMLQAFLDTLDARRAVGTSPGGALPAALGRLRRVICSGEALGAELARRFFERVAEAELHNLYGPTEASIDVTAWQCQPDEAAATLPIGHPIANIQMYVLDPHGQRLPPGLLGEIHIGGVGLARGYHERPALTAERFIPDAFGRMPGGRLYRTGDLGRYRADGAIEFAGRFDHQVKIRGQRIELGEIEGRLLQHPRVREAVVLAVASAAPGGPKRLVAYVSEQGAPVAPAAAEASPAANAGALAARELQTWVERALPAYMVPAQVLVLEQLPLSPNGKVDRRALPAPDTLLAREPYVAPESAAELALAEIWAAVLHQPRVSVRDDFFELGGDSITTLQVIARATTRGLSLTPKLVFENPRLCDLARAAAATKPAATSATPSTPGPAAPVAPGAELSRDDWQALLTELES
jgi:amino acid adenylation domain-containing protein/non-ribosomal peptide synthase protein (TIGR01720 family)